MLPGARRGRADGGASLFCLATPCICLLKAKVLRADPALWSALELPQQAPTTSRPHTQLTHHLRPLARGVNTLHLLTLHACPPHSEPALGTPLSTSTDQGRLAFLCDAMDHGRTANKVRSCSRSHSRCPPLVSYHSLHMLTCGSPSVPIAPWPNLTAQTTCLLSSTSPALRKRHPTTTTTTPSTSPRGGG